MQRLSGAEIYRIELNILFELDYYFQENNLRYYLS